MVTFKSKSSGMWRRVVLWWDTDVSEVPAASTVQCHNPEDLDLNHHRRHNLKSRTKNSHDEL
jgi:hypothetical protein